MIKVENMVSSKGNTVANQFIITTDDAIFFQSYGSLIAMKKDGKITLFEDWNYSKTTSKYRAAFLRETTAETQKKLDNGEYTLTNSNTITL